MRTLNITPHPFTHLTDCFLAGGSILSTMTRTEVSDYDLYPKSSKSVVDILRYLEEESCYIVNITDKAITLKSNTLTDLNGKRIIIQIILFQDFPTADVVFSTFDFTVCMGAYDCDTKEYVFHPDFWPDVASKTLRFNAGTRNPLNSMVRMLKYQKKGYVISTPEMLKMSLNLMQSKVPTSWLELEQAIGGVYGRQIVLDTGDAPFTLQNAIEYLSELNIDLLQTIATEDTAYHQIADIFDVLFEHSEIYYYTIEKTDAKLLYTPTGIIVNDNHITEKLIQIFKIKLTEGSPDNLVYGYKTFTEKADGTLENNVYWSKKIKYKINEWVEESVYPHIFVYKNTDTITSKTHKVMFKVSDVQDSRDKELKVSRVMVVGRE